MKKLEELKIGDEIELQINHQGAPRISHGVIEEIGGTIYLLDIDLHSKYCRISAEGNNAENPCIVLEASSDSLYIDESKKEEMTEIEFPQFAGYDIWCSEISKYMLRICMKKMEK